MSITLLELKNAARDRADMQNSDFVTDPELTQYINASIAELHDLLVQSYGADYYVDSLNFNTIVNQDSYDLPTEFYKLMGVDAVLNGSEFLTLRRFNFNERNRYEFGEASTLTGVPYLRYRLVGNKLKFLPAPKANTEIRVWFIPLAEKLNDDSDTMNDLNAYSEYVIVDSAIKMMQKEESDVSVLMAQKMALKQRIEQASQNRDAGESESISDVYEDDDLYYRRS